MMIAYHAAWDADLLHVAGFNLESPFWVVFGQIVRLGFISLIGFSLFLSHRKNPSYSLFLARQAKRAVKLFGVALIISLASWIFMPGSFIRFGILHFISFGIVVGALILPSASLTVIVLVASIALGIVFSKLTVSLSFLIPFGLSPADFSSIDYFPLFPWISVICAGLLLARWFDRLSWLKNPKKLPRIHSLEFLGRHSLLIYVLHQPVLFGLLRILA